MSLTKKDTKRLEHMLIATRKAIEFAGTDHDEFAASDLHQSAVIRRLLILGEAAKAVSQEARDLAPELPWREMMRMRDVLIHHYFGVRLDVVWGVVTDERPGVQHELEDLLASGSK